MRYTLIPVYSPQRGCECPWRDLINAYLILPCYFIIAPGAIVNRISLSYFTIYLFTLVYMNIIDFVCVHFQVLYPLLCWWSSTLQVSPTGRMLHSLTCNPFTPMYFPICLYPNASLKVKEHQRQESFHQYRLHSI